MMFRILIAALCLFSIHVKAQVNQKKADSLKAVIALANAEDKTEAYVKLIEVFEYKENDSADFYTRKLIQYGKTTKQLKPEIRGLLIKAKFFIHHLHCFKHHSCMLWNSIRLGIAHTDVV